MPHEVTDITIIGGGPTGLFAAFYAGMRGVTARIVDALPELGGQLLALYPEKYIFDVAGIPRILAKDLVKSLTEQARQFSPEVHLNQRVVALEDDGGSFTLVTETDRFPTRSILIAAGIGAERGGSGGTCDAVKTPGGYETADAAVPVSSKGINT